MTNGSEHNEELSRAALSQEDARHLIEVEKKFQLIRDLVASVATGRSTGLYLFGRGGIGKTHTVVRELERLQVPFKPFNSRLTGKGLYNHFESYPGDVILIEDTKQLFRDSGAVGVLLSALGSEDPKQGERSERRVTWNTNHQEHAVTFTGGVIVTANRPFPAQPELEALKTRIDYVHLAVDDNEMMALLRSVSLAGYQAGRDIMDATETLAVCEHIIGACRGLGRSLDMRMLNKGFKHYLPMAQLPVALRLARSR